MDDGGTVPARFESGSGISPQEERNAVTAYGVDQDIFVAGADSMDASGNSSYVSITAYALSGSEISGTYSGSMVITLVPSGV
jgi:hypothetical protein